MAITIVKNLFKLKMSKKKIRIMNKHQVVLWR